MEQPAQAHDSVVVRQIFELVDMACTDPRTHRECMREAAWWPEPHPMADLDEPSAYWVNE